MDLARLAEFESLFGHRYQALALVSLLQEGPMRWSEVGRAMDRRAEERVDDKYVTRSLKALEKAGFVRAMADGNGGQLRALTPHGTKRANRILDIFTQLDQRLDPSLNDS